MSCSLSSSWEFRLSLAHSWTAKGTWRARSTLWGCAKNGNWFVAEASGGRLWRRVAHPRSLLLRRHCPALRGPITLVPLPCLVQESDSVVESWTEDPSFLLPILGSSSQVLPLPRCCLKGHGFPSSAYPAALTSQCLACRKSLRGELPSTSHLEVSPSRMALSRI